MSTPTRRADAPEPVDLSEKGRRDGQLIRADRRLFFQLLVFTGCTDTQPLIEALTEADHAGVLYADLHDPRGVGVLSFSEDPADFAAHGRDLLNAAPFVGLDLRREFSMLGRTYAIGYESDLDDVLIDRPIRHATTPDWPWAVWYPLRRKGGFARIDADEQRKILMEHGSIGRRYVESGHAYDIRLASYGLDAADNDFTIGLVGPHLHGLSAIVQAMRDTIQTSTWLESLGPFFIGRALWQNRGA